MTTINSVGATLAGQTGTGLFVGSIAPTLGVVTATSINFGGSALNSYISPTAWTPVITFDTPGNLSVVYGTQQGAYVRIGNLVSVTWVIQFTPTFTTASGFLRITGLPVTPSASLVAAYYGTSYSSSVIYPAGTTNLISINQGGATYLNIYANGSAIGPQPLTTTATPTAGTYVLSGQLTYYA